MATIRDVAAHAQVSPGTVSQLLNGRAAVRPETRSRIEQAIAQLGYRPGRVGRPRSRPATANVALVFTEVTGRGYTPSEHPLSRRRIRYIREALIESGDHFSLFFLSETEPERNLVFREAVEGGDIHGVIYAPAGRGEDSSHLSCLEGRDVPMVLLQRFPHENEFSHVSLDDLGGGGRAAAHLLELGHRRLGHVQVRHAYHWAEARRQGFVAELERAGAPSPAVRTLDPDAGGAAAQPICQALLEQGVTGIFASNDGVAVLCINALEQLGVRVPQDVSVVGFDNMHYTSASGLTPTSLGYDARHFAQVAVRFVKQLIAEREGLAQLGAFVRTHLVIHDTTGPAPAA
ncbi:MAG: LacI family DNA-binding transcriptional regulator [Phycisphaeraceae bacterium]